MIFKAGIHNISEIQNIARHTWPSAFKDILTSEQIDYMLHMMYSSEALTKQLLNGHNFLIYKVKEKSMGFISHELIDVDKVKIHKFYVLPEHQKKGIGSILFSRLMEDASLSGIKTIQLNVNRFNKAVNYYKAKGFKIKLSEDIDIGNGYLMEDYVMEYLFKE